MPWQDHWKVYREATRFCIERDGKGSSFAWSYLKFDWGIAALSGFLNSMRKPGDPDPLDLLLHFFPEEKEKINKAAMMYLDQQLRKAAGVPPHDKEDIPW